MPKECVLISTARRRNTPPARRPARGPRARPSASSGSRPLPPLSAYHNTTRNPFRRCARCGSSRCATSHTVGAYGAHVPLSEQARAPLQLQPATGRGLGPQRRGSLHGHPRDIRVFRPQAPNREDHRRSRAVVVRLFRWHAAGLWLPQPKSRGRSLWWAVPSSRSLVPPASRSKTTNFR